MISSIVAPIVPDGTPTARPILAYSRLTGEPLAIVPSCSEPGRVHIVTMSGRCSCKGFQFRGRCRHVAPPAHPLADGGAAHLQVMRASGTWPALSPETKAKADLARQIWGSDDE